MTTVARTRRDLLTVSGPDALAYLQGQLSQDVAALPVGGVAWTFVLAPQGKVDGWGRVHRTHDDRMEIDVDPGAGEAWAARLQRFMLRTKATIDLTPDVPVVAVRGAEVPGGLPCGWPGVTGSDVLGEPAASGALDAVGTEAQEVDDAVLDGMRIRAGFPRWGAELTEDTIPASVGRWAIDAGVSFTKGCYTGQELVARIDSRGGNVPRRLMGLTVDGPPPEPGAAVTAAGADAGRVTSSAPDPTGDGSVALAFVPRSVEVGADGGPAAVDGVAAILSPLPIPPA